MPSKRNTNRDRIAELIAVQNWKRIDQQAWTAVRAELPRLSEETLVRHLRSLEIAIDPLFRGVDTASLDALEATLNDLTGLYKTYPAETRQIVIRAKNKTRFVAHNPKLAREKQVLKAEMVEWMLVWLGDPSLFPTWVALRKRVLDREMTTEPREK